MDYEKQGTDFLTETQTKMTVDYVGYDFHFDDDKEKRDIYRITLERKGKKYSFRFGQSIAESKKPGDYTKKRKAPTAYDVLTCLTKYEPGTFDNFCADYGYDTDSRKAEKTYHAVKEEFYGVQRLFNDVLERLQEIQ